MRTETIGKVCDLCGTSDDLQIHHICYDPELTQVLCVPCHQKQHVGHGVGKSTNSPLLTDAVRKKFIELHSIMATRRSAAIELGISEVTAYHWDKKMGFPRYVGSTNLGLSFNQTNGRCQIQVMVSDDAKAVLVDWKTRRGFSAQCDALENLLLEFRKKTDEE